MKFISLILFTLFLGLLNAQVVTNELPPSFQDTRLKTIQAVPSISIPKPDLAKVTQEDAIEDAMKDIPWRFGVEKAVNLHVNNSGSIIDNGDGTKTWMLRIISKDAKSINLNFDTFHLTANAKLFLYNDDRSDVLGAITHKNNNETGEFATRPIKGSAITLEMIVPSNEINFLELNISGIVYGYRSIHNKAAKAFGTSGSCNININCADGNNWQDVKRSIVIILRSNNTRWCSGSLVNNVRQDSTPYILTANHCGLQTNSIFIFNYESPNCSPNTDGSLSRSMSGAFSRATNANSDFHLFELTNSPPASYEVYYAGWDRSNTISNQTTGIHHPDGDVMKICVDYDSPVTSGYYTTNGTTHWTVLDWDRGTTEGGSSGSPLFNDNQQIIGQLHGGNAACGNNAEDYYGKFSVSWNAISGNTNQLKPWLDPDNVGTIQLAGLDTKPALYNVDLGLTAVVSQDAYLCQDSIVSPILIVKNSGNSAITSFTITYSVNGVISGSTPWTGSIVRNQIVQITIPSITLGNGSNLVSYTISPNGIVDQNLANNTVSSTTTVNKSPTFVNLKLKTDDYGNEVTWNFIESNGTAVLDNGGPYAQVSGGTIHNYVICLYDSCFNFNLFDSANDGFNGAFGNGYALITSSNGDTLIYENNFRGSTKTNTFCIQNINTSISSNNKNDVRFSFYPNPVKNGEVLRTSLNNEVQYEIYNISGKLISAGVSHEIRINQTPGLYLIKVIDPSSGEMIAREKIIVQ